MGGDESLNLQQRARFMSGTAIDLGRQSSTASSSSFYAEDAGDEDDGLLLGDGNKDALYASARNASLKSRVASIKDAFRTRSAPRMIVASCFSTMLAFALVLRCPIFVQWTLKPLGDLLGSAWKKEVEPLVVLMAFVAPFVVAGVVFYSEERAVGSLRSMQNGRLKRWMRASRRNFLLRGWGLDSVDWLAIFVFTVVQLSLFFGKLTMDYQAGKIAKAGLLQQSARAIGMNGTISMVLSLALVGRNSFVHKFLCLTSERASSYHVWCANFSVITLTMHGVGYMVAWQQVDEMWERLTPCTNCSPKENYRTFRNFFGLLALALLLIVALMSLERVRRNFFRSFMVTHFLNLFFLILTVGHYYPSIMWLMPAVFVYIMYRVSSLFNRGRASVISAASLGDKVVQLELRRDAFRGKLADFEPGQFVYIKVDAICRLEWHPFSISSSPLKNRHSFQLNAKVQGSFTKKLLKLIKRNQITSVRVDGYYGSGIQVNPHMIFVAGGSGIAPFLSVLEHLVQIADSNESVDDELDLPKTIWLVWTCRNVELMEAYAALLQSVQSSPRWKSKIYLHLTHGTTQNDDSSSEPQDDASYSERFAPTSNSRFAFAQRSHLNNVALFVGVVLGSLTPMYGVWLSARIARIFWLKRLLMALSALFGSILGGCGALALARRSRRRLAQLDDPIESPVNSSVKNELDMDFSSPLAPQTPRGQRAPASSLLSRDFRLTNSRPDLFASLRTIHSEIMENYGMRARVGVFVSGPASMQAETVRHAASFQGPPLSVHQKSFSV